MVDHFFARNRRSIPLFLETRIFACYIKGEVYHEDQFCKTEQSFPRWLRFACRSSVRAECSPFQTASAGNTTVVHGWVLISWCRIGNGSHTGLLHEMPHWSFLIATILMTFGVWLIMNRSLTTMLICMMINTIRIIMTIR